jgi:hypothetical protein
VCELLLVVGVVAYDRLRAEGEEEYRSEEERERVLVEEPAHADQ